LVRCLRSEFWYLEPEFLESSGFEETERLTWSRLRRMRIACDFSYWKALAGSGIDIHGVKLPREWQVAHHLYGLSIAVADFKAIRESLACLVRLFELRLEDFLFHIMLLSKQYEELAARIFLGGTPDTEALYTYEPDPLNYPRKIECALDLFRRAENAIQEKQ